MKVKSFNLLAGLSLILIFNSSFTFAQEIERSNRSENTTCKKISQSLWMQKTATGKKAQDWLVYEVSVLQKLLDKLGHFGPKPEYGENYDLGYYDKSTYEAVKKYQQENLPWVKATGSVGPVTLNFINKYELCNSDRRFAQLNFNKIFYLPGGGFTFKYPSSEFLFSILATEKEKTVLATYLDVCSLGEYADSQVTARTLCYKRNRDGALMGASLVSSILKDKKSNTCMKAPDTVKADLVDPNVMINGMRFLGYQTSYKEVGREIKSQVYTIWKNNKCYEFKLNREVSLLGANEDEYNALEKSDDLAIGRMQASLETIVFSK